MKIIIIYPLIGSLLQPCSTGAQLQLQPQSCHFFLDFFCFPRSTLSNNYYRDPHACQDVGGIPLQKCPLQHTSGLFCLHLCRSFLDWLLCILTVFGCFSATWTQYNHHKGPKQTTQVNWFINIFFIQSTGTSKWKKYFVKPIVYIFVYLHQKIYIFSETLSWSLERWFRTSWYRWVLLIQFSIRLVLQNPSVI